MMLDYRQRFVMCRRIPAMDDKLPQATATHKDTADAAEHIDSHLSTAALTGKKSEQRNYLVE